MDYLDYHWYYRISNDKDLKRHKMSKLELYNFEKSLSLSDFIETL